MEDLPIDVSNRLVRLESEQTSLMFSLERVKFLGNLILSIVMEETKTGEKKELVKIKQHKKENSKENSRNQLDDGPSKRT